MPLLKEGTTLADFNVPGMKPVLRLSDQIIFKAYESDFLHFFKRIDGNPSGPDAEFSDSSLIADSKSFSSKFILDIVDSGISFGIPSSILSDSVLNAELYWLSVLANFIGSVITVYLLLN